MTAPGESTSAEDGQPPPGLRRLAGAVPAGVAWVVDGRIRWANERLVELVGRGTDLVGSKLEDWLVDTGDGLPEAGLGPASARPAARRVTCEIRRPAGDLRSVVCHCAWRDERERSSAYVLEDVSHVRRLEREIHRAGRELLQAHRDLEASREQVRRERTEREELLDVVSHELRTPVTVIGGYHRLLLAKDVGPLTEKQREFLEESQRSCQRLDAFIANLLEASRSARAEEALELNLGSLAPVIHGVAAMFRPLLVEHELRLAIRLDARAGQARFDRLRLEQVLSNLVANAVKFTPAGGSIEIATRAFETPEGEWVRRWVEICVRDDGPGIPPQDRERVFEPYVQLGEERGAGGLGLGLAICRRLVSAHGGAISLEEASSGGCSFHFTLPAELPSRRSALPADPPSRPSAPGGA